MTLSSSALLLASSANEIATQRCIGRSSANFLGFFRKMPTDTTSASTPDRRTWATIEGTAPDGCTMDAAGGIWFSDAVVWPLVLVASGGALIWRGSLGDPRAGVRYHDEAVPPPAGVPLLNEHV